MVKDEPIRIPTRKCLRCEHEWVLRRAEEPIICPKCKSPYWNKKRK